MIKLALIGAGDRGMTYARYAHNTASAQITAIADVNAEHLKAAGLELEVPAEGLYGTAEELLSRPKLADAAIIATMDRDHYRQAVSALDAGYDVLLEKPISPDAGECLKIAEKAAETGRNVVVCHVLRYAPFFKAIKDILDSGELGRVMDIQHNENIGNYHMAHSFVRGNWRDSSATSPIIMQKSCHDMDLLTWYADSHCKSISSFGNLGYFKPQSAPQGAAKRCRDCRYRDNCRYSCYLCYEPMRGEWPATAITLDQSEQGLREALDFGPYGRCVYYCDNDVCDRQVVNMEFENGVTATFNLSAFTGSISRTLKIMCADGELRAHLELNQIEIIRFAPNEKAGAASKFVFPETPESKHAGGDAGLMRDFLALIKGESSFSRSDAASSTESHLMACAAEEARVGRAVVDMREFRNRLK